MGSGGVSRRALTTSILERPHLLGALSFPTPIVALIGPIGAGSTTLLRHWAATRKESVAWGSPGSIPDPDGDVLIIDHADDLTTSDWERLRELRAENPHLLIRLAVHSREALPPASDIERVYGLLFTEDETRDFLVMVGSQLAPAAVHVATGGLAAAVRAVAWLKHIGGTVMNEVLATLPPGALAASEARLAIPEVLTAEVVAELGGPGDFLERAEREGRGSWVGETGHPLFVLTAPVRAATLRSFPADDADTVREQTGRALLAQGAWYGALVEGAASGSLPIIDAAFRGAGIPLLRTHGQQLIVRLRGLHVWELRNWPITAIALALLYNARREHRLRAVEFMGVALVGARTAPAGSGERALLRIIESVLQRLLGLGDSGVKAARAATRILDELPPERYRALEGLMGDLRSHGAVSLLNAGAPEEAAVEFERALAVAGRPAIELMSFGGIALIHTYAGDLPTAQSWVDTAMQRSWDEETLNEYAGSMLRMAQTRLFLENNELDRAEEALATIWPIIDTIEHWPQLTYLRAVLDICQGDADLGLERFRAMRVRRGTRISRSQTKLLDLTDSLLSIATGDVASARALTVRAGDRASTKIGVARALVFDGQFERARALLAEVPATTPDERARVAVLEAIVLRRLGHAEQAALAARRAHTVAGTYGLRTPFLLVAEEDRSIFDETFAWPAPGVKIADAAPRLTVRERVILRELVHSANVTAIAERLHVSANTVKSQRRSLYRKLGAASREEALAAAATHGLLRD
ncbi:LuxR C-terminal-related transcriptional regulator [Microbacterium sp.]|uniref:LuxR C-terminal-related transcriptional regulator n=1 Tax=Microbacterium sp. TaxID=51671 RepID=UPI003F9E1942